jgi:uncharacterized membrane protein
MQHLTADGNMIMVEAVNPVSYEQEHGRGCGCKPSSEGTPSARAILDRRYASGEITREQYEQMKQDLGLATKAKKGCC